MLSFQLENTFVQALPADLSTENIPRIVSNSAYSFVLPRQASKPKLLAYSEDLLKSIGLSEQDARSDWFLKIFVGNQIIAHTQPYAMCYGGHQFGQWAGQLGDGRAINLTEVVHHQQRWTLQLKGAGPTPYSRGADGLAVLRSSVREFLCSEAMYYLGIPTTRALSLIGTGDRVLRDMLYDGHPQLEEGAVVCRVAENFIRFGNFEIFSARKDVLNLKKLSDYVIHYSYPHLEQEGEKKYLMFFEEVCQKTIRLINEWQRVGFVHGVMNTDNMSILGLTIDYGPYGWLEVYDPHWTPNTTDRAHHRYAFGQQNQIALWNLAQLANALFPLSGEAEKLNQILNETRELSLVLFYEMMSQKLGLAIPGVNHKPLIDELLQLLPIQEVDYIILFRKLALYNKQDLSITIDPIREAFYSSEIAEAAWIAWLNKYLTCLQQNNSDDETRRTNMNRVNPKYVLRNYMAHLAIEKAISGDYDMLHELQELLKHPYEEQMEMEKWFARRPEWARTKVGCSMLSCSS